MSYNELIDILLSDDVCNRIKEKESEIFELIPELKECLGFNQNNKWHIYDVYEHILNVIAGVDNDKCLRIASLFHDIGKPQTYIEDEKGIGHFYGHWDKSLEIFNKYKDKFDLTNNEINLIKSLIYYHDINVDKMNDEDLNEMISNIGHDNINLLFTLKRADLLAQSSEFHDLLKTINIQEQNIIRMKK